jgi:hypothetical protein
MNLRTAPSWMIVALAGTLLVSCLAVLGGEGVTVRKVDDRVRIEIEGEWFGDYHYQGVSRPFVYPLLGPGGVKLTRDWPMAERAGEERDHPHHKSLWYAHGAVNGHDFWSESQNAGKTVHVDFLELSSGRDAGVIRTSNRLVAKDGTVVGTDERTLRIYNRLEGRQFDFEITIHASHGELILGDTKEGTMAVRLAETMRLKPNKANEGKPTGHIVNSEGVRDGETWGKRAAWVDYHGPVDGRTMGLAIFDHPENPRHPTWWHVRDYGLFGANPFGIHDFEKKPAGTGDLRVPAGESVTFRYRFYIHEGDEKEAQVARRYAEYANTAKRD